MVASGEVAMREESVGTRLGRLHVRRLGSGPPVVLWHSLYVDGRSMLPVAEALASDREVIVPDGPGHGRSPAAGRRYTLDDCALAACDLLDALGMPVVDWVGNAWGGHIGVVLARRSPERVRSLVTMCAPLHPVTGKDRARATFLLWVYRLFGPIDTIARPIEKTLVLSGNEAATNHVREVFAAQERGGMAEAIASVMLGRPSLEGPIPVRTLFVSTEKNALSTPDQARAQAQGAGAEFAVLSGSRHLPPLEEPDAVVALLRPWLARG
jgi:pimeloyl-ACP methyl ester carboxylesterase